MHPLTDTRHGYTALQPAPVVPDGRPHFALAPGFLRTLSKAGSDKRDRHHSIL